MAIGTLRIKGRRLLLTTAAVATLGAVVSPAAQAYRPLKSLVSLPPMTSQLTGVCSFPITITGSLSATEIDFRNGSGRIVRTAFHATETDVFSANGVTLVGVPYHFNVEVRFDSNGNTVSIVGNGVAEHLPLPGGGVFLSAGRTDFLARGDAFILTPDRGTGGDIPALCAALAG